MQNKIFYKGIILIVCFLFINTLQAQQWYKNILYFNKTGTDGVVYQNQIIFKAGSDGCSVDPNSVMYGFLANNDGTIMTKSAYKIVPSNPKNITVPTNVYKLLTVGNVKFAAQEVSIKTTNGPIESFAKINFIPPSQESTLVATIGGVFDPNVTIGANWGTLGEVNKTMLNGSTISDMLTLVGGAAAYTKQAYTGSTNPDNISVTPLDPTTPIVNGDVFYVTKANANGCPGYRRKIFQVLLEAGTTFYKDSDGDGFGNPADSIQAIEQPTGYVTASGDCNDSDVNINPAAVEIYDQIDNNCDGNIDEGFTAYYKDMDSDTYGDMSDTHPEYYTAANVPAQKASNNTDCNDNNININPGAEEIPNNGIDENCDGLGALRNVYRTHASCTTGGKLRVSTDQPNGTTLTLISNGVNVASGNITDGQLLFENLAEGNYTIEGLGLPINLTILNIDNLQ